MRILAFALLLAFALRAEDKWTYVKAGPFEVWTNGNDKHAKLRLAEAEQFRHALSGILAKPELKSIWPIRILAVKDKRLAAKPLTLVRDRYVAVIPNEQPLDAAFRKAAARIFLHANTKRYPGSVDQGLEEILGAFDVNGTHITLLAPPVAERNPAWARIHMMMTDPAFSGRMRVYLSNLENGADEGIACRNSFDKPVAEVEKLVRAHMAKSSYEPKPLTGRPIKAESDYYTKTLPSDQARIAEVDAGMSKAVSLSDLLTPEAFETREMYDKAVAAGSQSARAWLEHGLRTKDRSAFVKAAQLNPLWGAPHAELAKLEAAAPARAMLEWKQAANLEVRTVEYWREYALAATKANQFPEAAKAWTGAERAAGSDEERGRLKQARMDLETQRADFAASERQRISDERYREIERLKAEALADIRKAEMKANERLGGAGEIDKSKLEKWWDGPRGEKVTGQLTKIDCLAGGIAKWTIVAGAKTTVLVVREPGKIAISGSTEVTFGCGLQKPARKATVEYAPKPDAKLGSAGDVLVVTFP